MGSGLVTRDYSTRRFFITTSSVISDLNARANNSTELLTDSDAFDLHVRLILAQSFVYSIKARDQKTKRYSVAEKVKIELNKSCCRTWSIFHDSSCSAYILPVC